MSPRNTSDMIEKYLKELLEDAGVIEIKRNELSIQFDVVPSQINYVIKTRFNIEQGYEVESKRGGGGYIRIVKIKLTDASSFLRQLIHYVGDQISEKNSYELIQRLFDDGIITQREANLVLAMVSESTFKDFSDANKARAKILRAFLERLAYS
ncbi:MULTISPECIES: CtsR family transcriptional regulator [unclassified Enterococcus]|uniref:CtsR family transcriptional regulator n=1 Tax=unclassified Enterococcus TaxID=2608891 RepID=UPI0015576F9F|nr:MULTISPECIES: CtsR family transcriptional regulator [unclassified Enterococcus]MBS7575955.1 CtsR family transcriptional regulator [Enterococcus sp. MMGLQ5-2]MBS7583188.1 CtsR family transcriptional regulator [Enterococcus sp. MMGLQ5-1]NPD11048.1 CtsR family transcriptional regulator [Enterococcus sp. MMGLQ5-1]NPD35791.1 CtsR family transcriptional regulator [Enterococcus sp. MMGLQ5-2]